ncbi:MAG: hypothetical protein AAF611_10950 [Bacteroidota bacterium]
MKKSSKKMQLKKRSISELNAKQVTGGAITTTTTTLISIFCPSMIYVGEDICWAPPQE